MRDTTLLLLHLLVLIGKTLRPSEVKTVMAENIMMKQQLFVLGRPRRKAPNLKPADRFIFGWLSFLIAPKRLAKTAIIVKPTTILKFHRALVKRKYRQLFSSKAYGKPGPKGPSREIIKVIVELKRRNPRYGCPRIGRAPGVLPPAALVHPCTSHNRSTSRLALI